MSAANQSSEGRPSRRPLRTTSAALDKPSKRQKANFSASKGEIEENLEIKLLERGFMVKSKIAVAEEGTISVPYYEASTKDGLPFFVSLTTPDCIPRNGVRRVGTYTERTVEKDQLVCSAVEAALGILCGFAFATAGIYYFFERDDGGDVRATCIVFEREAPASSERGESGVAGEEWVEAPRVWPLVYQEEILGAPEDTFNNIREAWKRLYELNVEKSSYEMQTLAQALNGLIDRHDVLAETVGAVGEILRDGVEKLLGVDAQLRLQAAADTRDAAQIRAVEAALNERHAALRQFFDAAFKIGGVARRLEEAQAQLWEVEGMLAPMRDLVVRTES